MRDGMFKNALVVLIVILTAAMAGSQVVHGLWASLFGALAKVGL